jgi:hypothetical protein
MGRKKYNIEAVGTFYLQSGSIKLTQEKFGICTYQYTDRLLREHGYKKIMRDMRKRLKTNISLLEIDKDIRQTIREENSISLMALSERVKNMVTNENEKLDSVDLQRLARCLLLINEAVFGTTELEITNYDNGVEGTLFDE